MRCEAVQQALSEAMDRGPAPTERQLEHVRTCPRCTGFQQRAWRLRELARFEVAAPVPDLVAPIMERVRAEAPRTPVAVRRFRHRRSGRTSWAAAVAAALVIGLVVGFVLGSGGLVSPPPENVAALAAEIPTRLRSAAVELNGYRATFDITERNWTRSVRERTFVADVAFGQPESFRVQVRDTTSYPSDAWPRNDLSLVTDGRSYRAVGPNPCPAAALPACPQPGPVERVVANRAPFDPQSSAPTDVVVPMTVLAAADRVDVHGTGTVAGRDAVVVQLRYQDAGPLFQYLRFLGSWRPFFPEDRVLVWLDRSTWFPLRYELYPASGSEREAWAAHLGLPREPPDRPVFTAAVRDFSTALPQPTSFAVRASAGSTDEGFLDRPVAELSGAAVTQPEVTAGLQPWRFGSFEPSRSRPFRETIAAYARGLSWLTVTRVEGWDQRLVFGVGPFAEPIPFDGGGVGYYEPASESEPRRVALHTSDGEFLVSSNLPRSALLEVAASLPVEGRPVPSTWLTRRWEGGLVQEGLSPRDAVERAGFPVLVPASLPAGYRAVAGQFFRGRDTRGLAIAFRRGAAEMDGVGLLLNEAVGQPVPPPTGGDEQAVRVRDVIGRWSPGRHELEWVEGDLYISLSGPGFGLTELLAVASSLIPGSTTP